MGPSVFWNLTFTNNWVPLCKVNIIFQTSRPWRKILEVLILHQNDIYEERERARTNYRQRRWQRTTDFFRPLTLNISSQRRNNALSRFFFGEKLSSLKSTCLCTHVLLCVSLTCCSDLHPKVFFDAGCSFLFVWLLLLLFFLHFSPSTFHFVEGHVFGSISCVFLGFFSKKLLLFTPLSRVSCAESRKSVKQRVPFTMSQRPFLLLE